MIYKQTGFPGGSAGKESACNEGDLVLIPGLERSPGEGNGNSLQYCLENPMDRGAWRAPVHGVAESDATERLHVLVHWVFMSAQGLSLVLETRGCCSIEVHGLLIAVVSLVAEHRLQARGLP